MLHPFIQPEGLRTDRYVPGSGGTGNDIWSMLLACVTGDSGIVRELLEKDSAIANCSWGYFSPLHFAAREGHADIVRLLLQHGANVADKSGLSWQDTPLQKAIARGHHSVAAMLQEHLERTLHFAPFGETMAALIRERNESEILRWLYSNPNDVIHASDDRGNTTLHWAVLTRQLKLIDVLIERGADIESTRADGCKVVHLALEGDYFYRSGRDLPAEAIRDESFMVGYLVAKGARYDIGIAAAVGDAEHVRVLLAQSPELAKAKDSAGRSALYYSAKRGHIRVVEALLSCGADPNQAETSASQGAALYAAASGNHLECAKLLLAHGADPNAEVEASGNAVFISMSNGYSDMQQLLYAHGGTVTLTGACALGRLDLAGEILALNPSAASSDGDYGPLAQAASCGYTDLVRLLLKYEVNLTNPWYASNYMDYAFRYADKEMVQLLLDHGADANHLNWLGVSYLHLIVMKGDTELAELLIDYGANINAIEDEHCTTPLGWAAKYGRAEMVAFLLQQSANKAPAGVPEWATPLAYAKRGGHTAVVEMLLMENNT